jgi:hypothetical protein
MKENTPNNINSAVEKKNKNENSIFMKLFFHFILIIVIGIIIMKFTNDINQLKIKNQNIIIRNDKEIDTLQKNILILQIKSQNDFLDNSRMLNENNGKDEKIISLKKQIDGHIESILSANNKIMEKEREINSLKRLILDKNAELKITQEKMLQKEDIIYTMKNRIKTKDVIIDNLNKEKVEIKIKEKESIEIEKCFFTLKKRIDNEIEEIERKEKEKEKKYQYQGSDLVDYHFLNLISTILKDDNSKWKMIYKGTRDGFGAKDFHRKCDNHPNTITIISANNHTFGGFTSIPWHSRDTSSYDPNAFLFSLDTKSGKFTKYNQDGEYHSEMISISGHSLCGPAFGGGTDVKLFF